jgi:hypothetical protein
MTRPVAAVVEMPWLCNVVADHDRRYRLHADVAGDAPPVDLPDGRTFRPTTVTAEWTWLFGPVDGWHLQAVLVDGPAAGDSDERVQRWWTTDQTLPGWLTRLLDREHPAGVVGT